jgi:hypothetical protein
VTKISQLSSIGDSLAIGDQFLIRDIDDAGSPNKSVTVSGIARALADGNATAPALAFAADKNTGIYRTGTDSLAVATNGTGRLFINSTGLVSIGTSVPRGLLTSQPSAGITITYDDASGDAFFISNENITGGSGNFGGGITWGKPENAGAARVASIASVQTTGDTDQCGLAFFTKASASNAADLQESLRVTHDGKVGIGTTSPNTQLEVVGASPNIRIKPSANTQTGTHSFVNTSDSTRGYLAYDYNSEALLLGANAAERARIDSSGRLLVGTSSASQSFDGGTTIGAQIEHTGSSNKNLLRLVSNAAANWSSILSFARSRGTTNGAVTAVASDDNLGSLSWAGADGTGHVLAAQILASVDGTPGANDMPGRLVFSTTADGAATPTERLRITSAGLVGIGTSAPAFSTQIGSTSLSNEVTTNAAGSKFGLIGGGYNTPVAGVGLFMSAGLGNAGTVCGLNAYVVGSGAGGTYTTDLRISSKTSHAHVNTDIVTVTGAGRVGIGTTSPAQALQVAGNIQIQANGYVNAGSSGGEISLFAGGTLVGSNRGGQIDLVGGNASSDAGAIRFRTGTGTGGTAQSERARIDSSGRLGIGTTSPGTNFHLNNNPSWAIPTGGIPTNTQAWISSAIYAGLGIQGSSAGATYLLFADENDGDAGYISYAHSADSMIFGVNAAERARIDSSGRLLVGTSSSSGQNASLQVVSSECAQFHKGSADTGPATLNFSKSRNTSYGSFTSVQAEDRLGSIAFRGDDGTDYATRAAEIVAFVDGTPGTNDMPGRLVFSTTSDSASTPTERLRITSTGQVRLAGAGITFNGDTAAANELDDYEEGTWTVSFFDAVTGGNASATTDTGYYTKIGDRVICNFTTSNIDTTGMTGANNLFFTLPFTSSASKGVHFGSCALENINANDASITIAASVNASVARGYLLGSVDNAGFSAIIVSNLTSTAADVWVSITYAA